MKLIRATANKDGSSTVTVRLQPGERAVIGNGLVLPIVGLVEPVMIHTGYYYRLGGQLDDIVAPHVITDATRGYWCSIEQKWIEA